MMAIVWKDNEPYTDGLQILSLVVDLTISSMTYTPDWLCSDMKQHVSGSLHGSTSYSLEPQVGWVHVAQISQLGNIGNLE